MKRSAWPASARRVSKALSLAAHGIGDMRIGGARKQIGRKGRCGRLAVALGDEARFLRRQRVGFTPQHVETGFRLRVVEEDQQLSGIDELTLGDADLANDTTFEMLNRLAVRFHHDHARRH